MMLHGTQDENTFYVQLPLKYSFDTLASYFEHVEYL